MRRVVDAEQLVGELAGVHRRGDPVDLLQHVLALVVAGQHDRDVRRLAARAGGRTVRLRRGRHERLRGLPVDRGRHRLLRRRRPLRDHLGGRRARRLDGRTGIREWLVHLVREPTRARPGRRARRLRARGRSPARSPRPVSPRRRGRSTTGPTRPVSPPARPTPAAAGRPCGPAGAPAAGRPHARGRRSPAPGHRRAHRTRPAGSAPRASRRPAAPAARRGARRPARPHRPRPRDGHRPDAPRT